MRKVFEAWYVTFFWGRTEHTYVYTSKESAVQFLRLCRRRGKEAYMQMFESIMTKDGIRPVEEDDPEWELVVNKSPMCEYSCEAVEDDE